MAINDKIQAEVLHQRENPQALCRSNVKARQTQRDTSDPGAGDTLRHIVLESIERSNSSEGAPSRAFNKGQTTGKTDKIWRLVSAQLTQGHLWQHQFSTMVFSSRLLEEVPGAADSQYLRPGRQMDGLGIKLPQSRVTKNVFSFCQIRTIP